MSERFSIEIDASPWMDANGIESSVYLGDGCEPVYNSKLTYKELIDQELEAHTICGKLTGNNIEYADKFVTALEEAVAYARIRFEELQQ